ncbi:MAG: hypothetical protein QXK37_04355 [Candidatus Woesearchaeota archaeon]
MKDELKVLAIIAFFLVVTLRLADATGTGGMVYTLHIYDPTDVEIANCTSEFAPTDPVDTSPSNYHTTISKCTLDELPCLKLGQYRGNVTALARTGVPTVNVSTTNLFYCNYVIKLSSPASYNNSIDPGKSISFTCSMNHTTTNMVNASLIISRNNRSLYIVSTKTVSGNYDTETFEVESLYPAEQVTDTSWRWNCLVFNSSGGYNTSTYSNTFSSWNLGTHSRTKSESSYYTTPLTLNTTSMVVIPYGANVDQEYYRNYSDGALSSQYNMVEVGGTTNTVRTARYYTTGEVFVGTTDTAANTVYTTQFWKGGQWFDNRTITTNGGGVGNLAVAYLYGGYPIACYRDNNKGQSNVYCDRRNTTGGWQTTLLMSMGNYLNIMDIFSSPYSDIAIVVATDNAEDMQMTIYSNQPNIGIDTIELLDGAVHIGCKVFTAAWDKRGQGYVFYSPSRNSAQPISFYYRYWNGTLSSQLSGPAIADSESIRKMESVYSSTYDQVVILGGEATASKLYAWVMNATTMTFTNNTLTNTLAYPTRNDTNLHVVVDKTGRVMAAWGDSGSVKYSIWNGTEWSSPANIIGTTSAENIRMSADYDTNNIAIVYSDGTNKYLQVWNGTTWSSQMTIATNSPATVYPDFGVQYVRTYQPSGTYTSRSFNVGYVVNWTQITWSASTPSETTMTMQISYSNATDCSSGWTSWSASLSNPATLNVLARCTRYMVSMSSTNVTKTPSLYEVNLTYNATVSGGNATICDSTYKCLLFQNNTAYPARFDSFGNLDIKGTIAERQASLTPPAGSFVIQNSSAVVAYIDQAGNLRTRGYVLELNTSQPTGNNDFIIQNKTGNVVAYIDGTTGNVVLRGVLHYLAQYS